MEAMSDPLSVTWAVLKDSRSTVDMDSLDHRAGETGSQYDVSLSKYEYGKVCGASIEPRVFHVFVLNPGSRNGFDYSIMITEKNVFIIGTPI